MNEFQWLQTVLAVVMGVALTKIAGHLFDFMLVALTHISNAGERLWNHLSRRT